MPAKRLLFVVLLLPIVASVVVGVCIVVVVAGLSSHLLWVWGTV